MKYFELSKLVGEWEGTTSVQFSAGKTPQIDKVTGTMRLILGGKFVLHEYQGRMDGKSLSGTAIYGYNNGKKQFECAWVDSFHNGDSIMFSTGKMVGKNFSVLGSYVADCGDGRGELSYGWSTEIEIVNKDKIIITMTNISPDGKHEGGVETVYTLRKENT